MKLRRIYRFGPFGLDATAKVLLRDGEPVHAPRKAVETLLALVENNGRVVTKDELMEKLWPHRVVNEANLAQNIAVVRRVMGIEQGGPGFIETFPGTGYRIVGPITVADEAMEGPDARPAPVAGAETTARQGAVAEPLAGKRWVPWVYGGAAVIVVSLAPLWFMQRRAAPPEMHRVPVTRLAGKEYQPSLSPDGRSVAFVWERDESTKGGIWVATGEATSPHRVSSDDGAAYSSPAWSPDGRSLAFLRFQQGQGALVVAPVAGGAARSIAGVYRSRYGIAHRHLDWSPDGRTLALDDRQADGQALGIFLVDIETGERKRLTQPEDIIIGDIDPRFSPDGRTVSFIRAFHRARDELFTVAVGGGLPRQITSDARLVSGQDWMPDGSALVFGSNRSGEFRLWKASPSGGVPRGTPVYGDFPMQLSLSRGTRSLVYSVLQDDLNIWRLDLQTAGDAGARWTRLIASSGQDASPQYSPDGGRISFRSDRSGEEQIWVANGDGSNPVQVTQGSLRPSVPRWSPDGRALVFNDAATRKYHIARVSEGGVWSVQSFGLEAVHPVFSPDGRWIYGGTMTSIVRIPAAGGAASEIVNMMGISLGVSGDGRHIYFVREPSGTALWRVDVQSGRAEKALDGLVPYCSSCWALSPSGIYFLGNRDGTMEHQALYYHEFATGRETALAEYPAALSPIGSGPFSLSPNGRYLLCVRVDPSNSDIFRVDGFR